MQVPFACRSSDAIFPRREFNASSRMAPPAHQALLICISPFESVWFGQFLPDIGSRPDLYLWFMISIIDC